MIYWPWINFILKKQKNKHYSINVYFNFLFMEFLRNWPRCMCSFLCWHHSTKFVCNFPYFLETYFNSAWENWDDNIILMYLISMHIRKSIQGDINVGCGCWKPSDKFRMLVTSHGTNIKYLPPTLLSDILWFWWSIEMSPTFRKNITVTSFE